MTGIRGIAALPGFDGAAAGRFSGTPGFTEDFAAASGATLGVGFETALATDFAGVDAGLIAVFVRTPVDFVAFGCVLVGTTLAPLVDGPEAFETTGFTGVDRLGTEVAFPVAATAAFGFEGAATGFAGLTGTGAFFAATVFFATSCRDLTDFSADFVAGLDNDFGAVDFFAATTLDGDAFDAAAFTPGFTLAAALLDCDAGRDLEVSLGVGFTGVFAAGWRLLEFAGEFLIESLCVSIL